ncbi:hypothetical protein HDU86_007906 [Geranomyces michiganensis]|nr:hypothetical protein HDU86_007906 [Geranomyces michiganensis]
MSLPMIPGMRPGDGTSSIPFSKPAPRDQKQELRNYYREAGLVKDRAKADAIDLKTNNSRPDQDERNRMNDKADYRSEREMNLANFRELMNVFKTESTTGNGKLTLEQFKNAFAAVFGAELTDTQMSLLFCQVDANMDEAVDWDEFSTFMLLRAEGQSIMREQAEMQLFDEVSVRTPVSPHRDTVVRISWQHHALPGENAKSHTPWIHDCAFLPNVNKIALSSDDHAITFYDFTTMEPQLRLDLHDTVALSLNVFIETDNPDSDTTMLLYSTDSGHVSVLTFINSTLFPPTPVPSDHTPVIMIDAIAKEVPGTTLWKRKAHGDWALQVEYFHDVRSIVSCSADSRDSLVMATQTGAKKWRVVSASVRKGVTAFAYSKFPLALLTGGVDRQIRIWNPHRLTRPTASLSGHSSPITAITVSPRAGQAISLSVDRNVKIWDIRKQICLQTIIPAMIEHRADNTLSALYFNPSNGGKLIVGSSVVFVYGLADKEQHRGAIKSHEAPVRAALWNTVFEQVVSGCDASIVNVWDATTGQKTFRFTDVHDKAEITAMAFDSGCRRLITGGRVLFLEQRMHQPDAANLISSGSDGIIRWWNTRDMQLRLEQDAADDGREGIFSMCVNNSNTILITGDAGGVISVWDIRRACLLSAKDETPMDLVHTFKAHVRSVASLDLTDLDIIVSASTDCTVRMWTLAGDYIGTYGQPVPWDLSNPSTFAITKPPEIAQFESDTAEKLQRDEAEDSEQDNGFSAEPELGLAAAADTGAGADGGVADSVAIGSQRRVSPPKTAAGKKPDSSAPNRRPKTRTASGDTNTNNVRDDMTALTSPYRTFYANSLYASSKLNTHRRRPRALPPINNGKAFPVGGIFHCLQPYELGDTGLGVNNILRVGRTGGKR